MPLAKHAAYVGRHGVDDVGSRARALTFARGLVFVVVVVLIIPSSVVETLARVVVDAIDAGGRSAPFL
jgi:hypothetical protein